MKMSKVILLIALLIVVWACNKDDAPKTVDPDPIGQPDPDPDLEPENQAPSVFELLEVADTETDVALMPSFKWNTSTDPDGDMIGYDLLMGLEDDDQNTVATDLNTATYNLDEPLKRFTDYYWSVVAKDGKGKETKSETFSFMTRNVNNPSNADNPEAGFSPRLLHTVTHFNNQLFLFGGADTGVLEDKIFSDLWTSNDGTTWAGVDDSGLGPTRGHTTIAFNGTLWVLGGKSTQNRNSRNNLMYGSITGTKFDPGIAAPWQGRELHTSAVFLDRVWVLGGVTDTNQLMNDVWSTSDIKEWDANGKEHDLASWSARFGHSTVVFDNKLWVIGGNDGELKNDVWYTEDGDEWIPVPQENPFPIRVSHQTVVFDDKIWLVGGNGETGVEKGIWYSADGANWHELGEDYGFKGRIKPSLTIFKDQMLMIGGYDLSKYYNDVWVFD